MVNQKWPPLTASVYEITYISACICDYVTISRVIDICLYGERQFNEAITNDAVAERKSK